MLELWWTNAWVRDGTEWPGISNAPVPSMTAIWESWCPNGRASGDQWMVPEVWLSGCVGGGSEQNTNAAKPSTFQSSLARPVVN